MLDDKFIAGHPLARLSARWLNTVARILNHLRVELTDDALPSIEKPAQPSATNPWTIRIPRGGGSGGGGGAAFTLPSTVYWDNQNLRLCEREMAFDGSTFKPTGVIRTLVDFTPTQIGSVVSAISNTGTAITETTRTLTVYAPNGAIASDDTGDYTTSVVIGLTPREANESTPYGESATEG